MYISHIYVWLCYTLKVCQNVLWTDDLKSDRFSCKKRMYERSNPGETLNDKWVHPTVKHWGWPVMVLGMVGKEMAGDLV